jgi:hypothetical protein
LGFKFGAVILFGFFALSCQQKSTSNGNFGSATGATGVTVVQVSWTDTLGEQQGFYLEQSSDGTNFAQIQVVPDGTNSVNISGLNSKATYYFRVRGYNQAGTSPYSSLASVVVAY